MITMEDNNVDLNEFQGLFTSWYFWIVNNNVNFYDQMNVSLLSIFTQWKIGQSTLSRKRRKRKKKNI